MRSICSQWTLINIIQQLYNTKSSHYRSKCEIGEKIIKVEEKSKICILLNIRGSSQITQSNQNNKKIVIAEEN